MCEWMMFCTWFREILHSASELVEVPLVMALSPLRTEQQKENALSNVVSGASKVPAGKEGIDPCSSGMPKGKSASANIGTKGGPCGNKNFIDGGGGSGRLIIIIIIIIIHNHDGLVD